MAMMELGITQSTNIHNTRSLIRTFKYVLDILQTEEAFTVEEYKQTHTHTIARNSQTQEIYVTRKPINLANITKWLFMSIRRCTVCVHGLMSFRTAIKGKSL